uniref:Uncharacterized protein n=1 Tax=Avena sativa TaxID=4498 RepID=A0ACD5TVY7_AVESA
MDEEEEPTGQQVRLKEEHGVPGRRRVLHLSFARPAMSGRDYEGPAWKPFSSLHVYLGDSKVASLPLPESDDDLEAWWRPFEFAMGWEWPRLCLCLEAVREDYGVDNSTGRVVVFRPEEPHTSGHSAVIGAAVVPLLEALVLGDDDDDGSAKEVEKKRRLEQELNLAEGTHVFQERVKLQGWRARDAGGELANVVGGSVVVLLYMSEHNHDHDAGPGCSDCICQRFEIVLHKTIHTISGNVHHFIDLFEIAFPIHILFTATVPQMFPIYNCYNI